MRNAIFGGICALVIGLFIWSAEPGILESMSPLAEDSYYNLLVQGFQSGHLNIKRDAPPALAKLANPYDPSLNHSLVWYKDDLCYETSYYKGKLYLYFGVTPALVLFWPYNALTDGYLSATVAVVIFFSLGFLIAFGLLNALWRRYFPETSVWLVAAGVLALGLSSGALEILSSCDVYEVAKSCAFMFTMLALAGLWRALHEPKHSIKWLLLASLAFGLAVGSRPTLLYAAIILLIPVAQAWHGGSGSLWRISLLVLAAVLPLALVGLGLMLYNFLRFDNPFEFGWHYQLTGLDQHSAGRHFNFHFLWYNFRFYFLEPNRWAGGFPWLQARPISAAPVGHGGIGATYGGVLLDYPFVWLGLAVPLAFKRRTNGEVSALRWFVIAVFLLFAICAFAMCLFLVASSRYLFDFLPALMFLAAVGILGLERALAWSPARRLLARFAWCLLLAYTIVFSSLASVGAHAANEDFIGNSLLSGGPPDEAIEYFQRALRFEPKSASYHCSLGSAYSKAGQNDEAFKEFQTSLQIDPGFTEAHCDLGHYLIQTGHTNEAVAEFERAIQLDPNVAESRVGLGSCLLRMGRKDDAIAQFQKAVELEPTSADSHGVLGAVLVQTGDFDKAIVQFEKAIELQPDSAHARFSLADAYSKKGAFNEAVAAYQKGIELQPGSPQAYNNLGDAFRGEGEATNAIASYRTAMDLAPQAMEPQINLAWMLATWPDAPVRNGSEAVALMTKANELSGNENARVLRALAAAYAETGKFTEAGITAKQALEQARSESDTALINKLQAELQRYQGNSPCRSKSD